MALTKLGGISEIGTAIAFHGLVTYIGTNLGNVYRMVNSTGVATLLDSVNEKIISMSIMHPTLYVSTVRGNVYSYAITVSDDKAASESIGSQANTAGSGVALTAAVPGAFRVFSDDNGLNIGDSVRGIQSRMLLTVDQSAGTIRSLQGQLKLLTGVDVTTGIYTAVQGYVELAGTHVVKTGATFSCFDASLEIGTSLTVDVGGEAFGVHVETTGAGTITNNGKCAGIGITKASGAASWPVGLLIDTSVVTTGILIGTCTTAIDIDCTTDTTSAVTGSIHTDGGVGIAKSLWVGTTLITGAGAVGAPAVQVGSADTGLYQVSAVQTGFAQDGVLVSLFDSEGLKPNSVQLRVAMGTTPVGTVAIKEYGDGKDITTVLTLTNFIVGALAGAAAGLGVGNIVYAFPAGQHLELVSALSDVVLTAAGTAVATDTGLGSVIASGAVLTLDGTATFEDRLTGQTINTDPAGGAAVSALKAATAGIGTGISLNVAASVKNVFLNSAGNWNADNTGNLTASGTIVLKWTRMA